MSVRLCMIAAALCALLVACGRSERDRLADGAQLYAANCAVCHGADARGGGGGAVEGLSKTPPDLTMLVAGNSGVFPTSTVLDTLEGYATGGLRGRGMLAFRDLKSDRKQRVKIDQTRVRTAEPLAALLAYLDSAQDR